MTNPLGTNRQIGEWELVLVSGIRGQFCAPDTCPPEWQEEIDQQTKGRKSDPESLTLHFVTAARRT